MDLARAAAVNARHWDVLARRHAAGTGRFYDLDALVAGVDPLWEAERDALARAVGVAGDGDGGPAVRGLRICHLQCHLGADAIWFARGGASVTGLDISGEALRLAAERAARCGASVDWVQADAADPPASLTGAFDLVWATIGVTCWAVDLERWFAAAASMLAPGGRLALVEIHPAYVMLDSLDPWYAGAPYGGGAVLVEETTSSYDDPAAEFEPSEVVFASWGVGDHVQAALAAGLRVKALLEHDSCEHDPRGLLTADPDGRFRLSVGSGGATLPVLFTLVAERER